MLDQDQGTCKMGKNRNPQAKSFLYSADLQRTIKRVVGKINRMRNDVLVARVLSGRPVIKIVLGSYYSAAIRLKDRGNKTLPQAMREAINS